MSSIAKVAAPVISASTASAAADPDAIGHPAYVTNRLQFATDYERRVWSTVQHLNAGDDHLTEFYTSDGRFMRQELPASKALQVFHQRRELGLTPEECQLIDTTKPDSDYTDADRISLFDMASQARLFVGTCGPSDRRAFLLVDTVLLKGCEKKLAPALAIDPPCAPYEGFPHGATPYPKPQGYWDHVMPSEYPVFPKSESHKYEFHISVPSAFKERSYRASDIFTAFTPDIHRMPWYRMMEEDLIDTPTQYNDPNSPCKPYQGNDRHRSGMRRNTPMPEHLPGDFYFNKRHYTLRFAAMLDWGRESVYTSVTTRYNTLQLRNPQGVVVDVLAQATYGQTLLLLHRIFKQTLKFMPNINEEYYPLCVVNHLSSTPSDPTTQVVSRALYYFECNTRSKETLRCTRLQAGRMDCLTVVSREKVEYRETRGDNGAPTKGGTVWYFNGGPSFNPRTRDGFIPSVAVAEPCATSNTGLKTVGYFDLPLTDLQTFIQHNPGKDMHLTAQMRSPDGTLVPTRTTLAYALRQTSFLNERGFYPYMHPLCIPRFFPVEPEGILSALRPFFSQLGSLKLDPAALILEYVDVTSPIPLPAAMIAIDAENHKKEAALKAGSAGSGAPTDKKN